MHNLNLSELLFISKQVQTLNHLTPLFAAESCSSAQELEKAARSAAIFLVLSERICILWCLLYFMGLFGRVLSCTR